MFPMNSSAASFRSL